MGHFHIRWGKEKKNHKTIQGHANKNCIYNAEHNTTYYKTISKNKYNKSGIYQMKCLDCPLKYIGRTGRTFHTRYKKHIQAISNNNSNSEYSSHILNTGHTYGTVTNTLGITRTHKKG
jgi:hypothetical protein